MLNMFYTCAAVAVFAALSEGFLEGARQSVARAGTDIPQITASLTGAETAGFPEDPRQLQAQAQDIEASSPEPYAPHLE